MDTSCRSGSRRPALLVHLAVVLAVCAAGATAFAAPAAATVPSPGDVTAWSVYNGAGNIDDQFRDATRGPYGAVYACGIDGSNGTASGDALVVRYSTGGGQVWQYHARPVGTTSAEGDAVAVDANGNVAVAGRAWNGGNFDIFVFKLDATGTKQWLATTVGAADDFDSASDVVFDRQGDVYVCGDVDDGAKAFVTKYAAAPDPAHPLTGRVLWTNTMTARAGGEAWFGGLAVDREGRVYVSGARTAANGHPDCVLRKIRPGGGTAWTRTWGGPAHKGDEGDEVILRDGRLFVGGGSFRFGHRDDLLMLRYDTGGHLKWARTWDDPAHQDDSFWDMEVDGHGNAYIAGETYLSSTKSAGEVAKWSATGVRRWARYYKGANNARNIDYRSLEVNSAGTAWVTGIVRSSPFHLLAIRYSAAGKRAWTCSWAGPPGYVGATSHASALSGTNRLFTAGDTYTFPTLHDAIGVWIVR
jgi:hypothetical protein